MLTWRHKWITYIDFLFVIISWTLAEARQDGYSPKVCSSFCLNCCFWVYLPNNLRRLFPAICFPPISSTACSASNLAGVLLLTQVSSVLSLSSFWQLDKKWFSCFSYLLLCYQCFSYKNWVHGKRMQVYTLSKQWPHVNMPLWPMPWGQIL